MRLLAVWIFSVCIASLALADEPVAEPELSVSQIVEKNVAARGGLDAWRKIQTMVWVGHIEGANAPVAKLPFVLVQKRPNKTRFELKAQNQILLRVFDGNRGWKVRPTSNGRPELQPYTGEELSFAVDGPGIDGPLMDYQAKGIAVTLGGIDEIGGHKAYRLNVRLPSGVSHHVWIDAKTFLDIKYDRESRNVHGLAIVSSVFCRNYQMVAGLQIPFIIESGADVSKASDKMVIDRVVLNSPLEDEEFARPNIPGMSNAVSVVADSPRDARLSGFTAPRSAPYGREPQ